MTIMERSSEAVNPRDVALAREVSAHRDMTAWMLARMMESTAPLPDMSDLISRPAWQKQAACRGDGTERFFPPAGAADMLEARRVCNSCPVIDECLHFALSDPGLKGIWAGTSGRQRIRMRALARNGNISVTNRHPAAALIGSQLRSYE
jgi:WhiB family redox-sensing transcriptional regulator